MPFAVGQLIEGRKEPVTVKLEDTIKHVLSLMIENDFSQLPVIDESGKPLGIVTSDSILRAISNFGVPLDALKATHALVRVDEYSVDEDLFDLLEDLKESYAVLIVNSERRLIGIVTSYDTTEYFRRRAEDMMYVEDIESTLKDFILASFPKKDGEPDADELNATLKDMSGNDLSKKFLAAMNYYFQQQTNDASSSKKVDPDLVKHAFDKFFMFHHQAKTFDDLTLYEYIQLLLHKNRWAFFEPIFALQPNAINKLLNEVRKTRNDLAHFHGEIIPQQRDQLHFCADWLAQLQIKIIAASSANKDISPSISDNTLNASNSPVYKALTEDMITPVAEEIDAYESHYILLAQALRQQPTHIKSIKYTFNQIEEIIGDELPTSARKHRAWWVNDSVGHVQSRQWLDAGWRVSNIDMTNEIITFTRIKEREEAYIDFFSGLLANLPIRSSVNPDGNSWITIARLLNGGPSVASLGISFARHERYRIELYIDTGEQEKNKHIFDALYTKKGEIQNALEGMSGSLEWERIDDKRASRIALYHAGSIWNKSKWAELQTWAIKEVSRFYEVMKQYISQVVAEMPASYRTNTVSHGN